MPRTNHPGFLLVIEGIDGAGKSTLVKGLARRVESLGLTPLVSREPTAGPFGAALRQSAKTGRLPLEEELQLFLADRAEHVREVITPALSAGKVVVLDRYYFSTAAYQGARGADPSAIIARHAGFAPEPDLVLLLDLDPIRGTGRIRQRGDEPDDFEALGELARVRAIFLALRQACIQRMDAARPADEVLQEGAGRLESALRAAGLLPEEGNGPFAGST